VLHSATSSPSTGVHWRRLRADKNCPYFRGKVGKRMHIGFPDPADATGTEEEILAVFGKTRDDIRDQFRALYDDEIAPRL
jgi:arsenate reductase